MSGLRYVDPDATTTAEVGGVTFTIGFWPPREAERIGALVRRSRKLGEDSAEGYDSAFEANRIAVQFGVRGWAKWEGGPDAAKELGSETIHGRAHPRLSDKATDALYHVPGGAFWSLAVAAFRWNSLQDEEKKRSDSPSG